MNSDKRQILRSLRVRISMKDLVPYLVDRIPKNELIYKLSYPDERCPGQFRDVEIYPPKLISELVDPSNSSWGRLDEVHIAFYNLDSVHVSTRVVSTVDSEPVASSKVYMFHPLDLVDP